MKTETPTETTDTPRTDAAMLREPYQVLELPCETVPANFARELERELVQATAKTQQLQARIHDLQRRLAEYEEEEDDGVTVEAPKPLEPAEVNALRKKVDYLLNLPGPFGVRGQAYDVLSEIDFAQATPEQVRTVNALWDVYEREARLAGLPWTWEGGAA